MIALAPGPLESREDILARDHLIRLVRSAGAVGVYQNSLRKTTRFATGLIERLLADVPEIAASPSTKPGTGRFLYKWIGLPNNSGKPEKS
jgi:hypothetical protein